MKLGCPTTRTMFRTGGWISLHGRGLRGVREFDLGLVAAAWRREGGQETEEEPAAVGGTIREPWAKGRGASGTSR